MHSVAKVILGAAVVAGLGAVAYAQTMPAAGPSASVNEPAGPLPDPGHIPITTDIVWTGNPNSEQQAKLFGDPSKPGMYGVLIKWNPGHYSHPHFHDQDRFIYVVSGTWWVSSSTHYDPTKTYPIHAGSYAEDVANTVHWDGARDGGPPAILELVGMGPVKTIRVGEDGKPLPPSRPAQ